MLAAAFAQVMIHSDEMGDLLALLLFWARVEPGLAPGTIDLEQDLAQLSCGAQLRNVRRLGNAE